MSAAAVAYKPVPLFQEGNRFWQELVDECKRYAQSINDAVSKRGCDSGQCVASHSGPELQMAKTGNPSTRITAAIDFPAWGPTISGIITGSEDEERTFLPEEFELPIAMDLDGEVVAIFDQGRSFSPHQFACYLIQNFHRCFPGISLPS